MLNYLSPDTIDISKHPYPDALKSISITIRGTKNLFDIFFSTADVETSFCITIPPQIDFTWINTPTGKEKYMSYPTIKRMLFQLKEDHEMVEPYLSWVDSLLFSNTKIKPFFRNSLSSIPSTCDTFDGDTFSDLDDSSSVHSLDSVSDNNYLVAALQHKVDQLENELELKNKDIQILNRDVLIRDKEIEILNLRLTIPVQDNWI